MQREGRSSAGPVYWAGFTFRECRFRKEGGHPLPADITDDFADRVIDVIGKGVVTQGGPTGGSPSKKLKGNDAGPIT